MPERVTREERIISMVIEKAREAKEILYQSMYDNNRSPMEDDNEAVKVKRPTAENAKNLVPDNRPNDGYNLGGQMVEFKKAMTLLKQLISKEEGNPFLDAEANKNRMKSLEADLEATNKEMDMLLSQLRSGGLDQKEFETRMGQLIGMLEQYISTSPFQGDGRTVLPKPNQYR